MSSNGPISDEYLCSYKLRNYLEGRALYSFMTKIPARIVNEHVEDWYNGFANNYPSLGSGDIFCRIDNVDVGFCWNSRKYQKLPSVGLLDMIKNLRALWETDDN